MNKMLVLDLDGTSITNSYSLSKELEELLKDLKKRMRICIVTGRSASDAYRYYQQLQLHDYIICNNGAYIWNPRDNDVAYCQYMCKSEEIIQYLLENQEKFKIENIIVSSGMNTYVLNKKNLFLCDMMYDKNLPYIYMDREKVKGLRDIHRIVLSSNADISDMKLQIGKITNKVDLFGWRGRNDIIDISMCDVDKCTAVKRLMLESDISMTDVIAFGDGENDKTLLAEAGIGVAMLNASDDVKRCADFITQYDNEHNGMYRFLIQNQLIV